MDFKLWDKYKLTTSTIKLKYFVKSAQICHFLRGPQLFFFFTFSILSKMAHFVILEKRSSNYEISMISLHHMLWAIRLFCQKCSILSFVERPVYFFTFQYCHQRPILSFWKSGIQIMRYSISTICDLNYFASSILSEMLNFVIFWEACVFFSLFQFVKNGPFCQFWKVDFKLWDKYKLTTSTLCVLINQTKVFCQKCSNLSLLRGP